MSATMTGFRVEVGDSLALTRAVSSFQALLVLDHAWTGLVASDEPGSEARDDVLVALAGQTLNELTAASAGATWLQDFVLRTGSTTIRGGFRDAVAQLPEDLRPLAGDLDEVYGDRIGALAELAYVGFRTSLADQRRTLVDELAQTLGGGTSTGDLFSNILCSIAAGALVGGVIMTAVPPFVHGPPIAAAGALAFKVFRCKLDDLEQNKKWRLS